MTAPVFCLYKRNSDGGAVATTYALAGRLTDVGYDSRGVVMIEIASDAAIPDVLTIGIDRRTAADLLRAVQAQLLRFDRIDAERAADVERMRRGPL